MNIEHIDPHKEKIAAEVHNAWWKEKESQGFHSPLECPKANKVLVGTTSKWGRLCDKWHTDMYPYEELDENIKDYDRATVQAVLNAIESI